MKGGTTGVPETDSARLARIVESFAGRRVAVLVDLACDDYLRRMPREIKPKLVTLAPATRKSRQSSRQTCQREAEMILERLAPGSYNLALDENGASWSSADWSRNLERWMFDQPRVNLIVGGADGLAPQCLEACQQQVSLGRMTMPHALVKVVLLEQLYRAWTILQGHPYHRE